MKSRIILFAALAGCSDSAEPSPLAAPSYVVATTVQDADTAVTYLSYQSEIAAGRLDLRAAPEFPGWSTVGGVGGKIFVGDGEGPNLTRFELDADGRPIETGRLSFLNEGASPTLYTNFFASADRAYLDLDGVKRVIWDPTALEIVGTLDLARIPATRDGMRVTAGYDRSVGVRPGRAFQPFYWADDAYFKFAPTSEIAVVDTDTDAVLTVLDAPCPGLDMVTADDAGNLYFSNWVFSVYWPLTDAAAPANCAVRVASGSETIDTSWTRQLGDLAGGREIAAFRYLADGIAVMAVLYNEMIPPGTPPDKLVDLSIWRLWRVDLAAQTAAPIEELGFFSGGYYAFRVDGKTLLLLPSADYATTTAYELPPSGPPIEVFSTDGWAYQVIDL